MAADKFVLIVPNAASASVPMPDREGGQTQSGLISWLVGSREIPPEALAAQMERLNANVELILSKLNQEVGGMALQGIDVGIAIEASGSIGIVAAGVKASMTLKFARG